MKKEDIEKGLKELHNPIPTDPCPKCSQDRRIPGLKRCEFCEFASSPVPVEQACWGFSDSLLSRPTTHNMKWNSIGDRAVRKCVPLDKRFIAFWKGIAVLMEYDHTIDQFCMCIFPAQDETIIKLAKHREYKITHWMEIPDEPEEL